MLDSKTWKPAVVMKRCGEPRSFIVKTEKWQNIKKKLNCQHLHQTADRNETDDTILIPRPWQDVQATALVHAITCANQEKGSLGGQ